MAPEQRIIGGGLLLVGIAVVLILIFTFWNSGMKPDEAFGRIKDDVWPAYLEAEKKSDYLRMKRRMQEVVDLLDDAGRNPVLTMVSGEVATAKNSPLARLHEMAKRGDLKRIADGKFPLDGGWFEQEAHLALKELSAAVEALKDMGKARRVAKAAREAVELATTGSNGAVKIGAAAFTPEDAGNPIYAHDTDLFRVLGTNPDDLSKALETPPEPAGKAKSARLRWNQSIATGTLSADVGELPSWIARLKGRGETIRDTTNKLQDVADAKPQVERLLGKAYRLLGAGLAEPHATAYADAKDKFQSAGMVAVILQTEARILEPYRLPLARLAPLFKNKFDP